MGARPSNDGVRRTHETTSLCVLGPLVGALHHWCASDFVQRSHAAVMRRISTSAATPEHANTMATVEESQALLPVW